MVKEIHLSDLQNSNRETVEFFFKNSEYYKLSYCLLTYIASFPGTFWNCVVVINILFAVPTWICELCQFVTPAVRSRVSPVVPQQEPLAGLLHVLLAVWGEDLRHLGLHLRQGDLQAGLATVSQPVDEFVVSYNRGRFRELNSLLSTLSGSLWTAWNKLLVIISASKPIEIFGSLI